MQLRKIFWMAGSAFTLCCGAADAQSVRSAPVPAPRVAKVLTQQRLTWMPAKTPPRPAFRSANSSTNYKVGPLTVEKQRTAFVSQVRVPLHSFFGGRVQLAGLHQRLRGVNVHSAVAVGDAASSYRTRSTGVLSARSQSTWGGGIWFQLGGPRT